MNPFSTRFVRPGAIPYTLPPPLTVTDLAARLAAAGGRGQVVGPHGSGKSSLLSALRPALVGWNVRETTLPEGGPIPGEVWESHPVGTLLVVDGFERLGPMARWRTVRYACRAGVGLLVTAHRSVGLPTLYRTDVTPGVAAAVVARSVPPGGEWVLAGYDVATRLAAHRGSLREVLFELYDRWEAGPATSPTSATPSQRPPAVPPGTGSLSPGRSRP